PTFWGIMLKTTVVHTVTYFAVGLLAFTVFDYSTRFADPGLSSLMRQTDHPLVAAGPLFQPIRGLLFGVVFYLLRAVVFGRRNGWLVMWVMLVFVGILSTFGPAPGSIEGLIYTTLPARGQLAGLTEVLLQSLLLSIVTHAWVRSPYRPWLNWLMSILFVIVMLLPALGLVLGQVTI
ncbi:MAG: hypothetical protein PVH50_06990, partial [Anaerolineae bacterium]